MKRIHSKDDIVQAGLEIMLSKGFNATGVDSILKQANVPRGSFYNFFASKEEFGLAIIDRYSAKIGEILQPVFNDESLPPLERIRKSFEILIEKFESNDCSKGCLIGNLSLEMSDQYEKVRQRLAKALHGWNEALSWLLLQARERGDIPSDTKPEMLAENLIASYEGALLLAKVKKSTEPLKTFLYLHFDKSGSEKK
jgi:TetR/AcrR family transcriptional repressor of nem operon